MKLLVLGATGATGRQVASQALEAGPRTGRYRAGERLELRGCLTISRADVADFILSELRNRAYLRRTVVLSY